MSEDFLIEIYCFLPMMDLFRASSTIMVSYLESGAIFNDLSPGIGVVVLLS